MGKKGRLSVRDKKNVQDDHRHITCKGGRGENGSQPGTERGGVGRTKYAGTIPNPGPKTQITCPVPQESGLITQTSPGTEQGG